MTYYLSLEMRGILLREEGYRQHPYLDSEGIETIGYGRNLRDVGISKIEASYLASTDINNACDQCEKKIDFFDTLDDVSKDVLVNLCFNMGIDKLLTFKNMLAALKTGDLATASGELLHSNAYLQEPNRIEELAHILLDGSYNGLGVSS